MMPMEILPACFLQRPSEAARIGVSGLRIVERSRTPAPARAASDPRGAQLLHESRVRVSPAAAGTPDRPRRRRACI
jgi:hypothetical protein